ncbi:hypothetical protein CR513_46651, partial [Mucuna pruriens]
MASKLRLELGHFGIDVMNIVPGAIKSNIGDSAKRSKSTHTNEFATHTIVTVLREKPPNGFSYGHYSTVMAIVYHLPIFLGVASIMDYIGEKQQRAIMMKSSSILPQHIHNVMENS